ncbi:hypothetical protein ISD45_10350 [Pseudomonas aeruginosa]|nr:hypothetical protein [Pseudomonas aeruginosa]
MSRKVEIDVERVLSVVMQSPKYRDISADTVRNITIWASRRAESEKEAVKLVKRKLHQIFAAFLPLSAKRSVERLVDKTLDGDADQSFAACKEILALHASTEERLPILHEYGVLLRSLVPPNGTVLDIACGLNPFTLPFVGLQGARYIASDIDCRLMTDIDRFLRAIDPRNAGVCSDALVSRPSERVDVVLLLKAVTTLEQQEKGASASLIAGLPAPTILMSFPTRSLGGHRRGMEATYRSLASSLFDGLGLVEEVLLGTELFFILRRD